MSDDELRASDAALEARTRGDLERVTVDLPAAHTAPLHRTRTRLVLALFAPVDRRTADGSALAFFGR